MMLVSFGEKQETTREKRAVVERKREQGNEGVANGRNEEKHWHPTSRGER